MGKILKISYFFNFILLLLCLFFGLLWKNMTVILINEEKEMASKLRNARFIISLVKSEFQGLPKHHIVEILNGIYAVHSDYESILPGYGSKMADCIYYGGVHLVFKEDLFVYFDDNFECTSLPVNGGLLNTGERK